MSDDTRPMVVADESEFPRLPSAVALYRAAQAQLEGDPERVEAFALKAFTLAGDGDPLGRAGGAGFLAFAHWGNGDLEAAHGFWSEAMASLQRAGHAVDAIGCNRPLAEIRVRPGSSARGDADLRARLADGDRRVDGPARGGRHARGHDRVGARVG